MTVYESNFLRLQRLLPDLRCVPIAALSQVPGDCDLHLELLHQSAYTTTMRLTYLFQEHGIEIADPDVQVRVYHDARLVEAMVCTTWHRHSVLQRIAANTGHELSTRWARNMMLNKWLEYCSDCGHHFQ